MSVLMDATRITIFSMLEYKCNFLDFCVKFNLNSHNVPDETSEKMLGIGKLQRGKE